MTERKSHSNRPILHLLGCLLAGSHGVTHIYLLSLLFVPFAAAQSGNPPPEDPYSYAKFNPSMAIIIVVLISAFFFMGFFSIYIRQCADARNGGSTRPAIIGHGRSNRGQRGLDSTVIETFPTFNYSVVKGLKLGREALECAVCLNEFEDEETLRLLPKCDHVFHAECIDAWLATHTTCPVCRSNLKPESGEAAVVSIPIPYSDGESDDERRRSDTGDAQNQNQVSVSVIEDQSRELRAPNVLNPCEIPIQNRPPRSGSRSMIPRFLSGRFPRSHSTGHSLVQPGENCERFTLRLPENVRKQIVNGKLNRTTSCLAFPTEASGRRGYRSSGEGSSRGKNYQFERLDRSAKSDRWVFSMAPPFFSRTYSARFPKKPVEGEATTSKPFFTSVKTQFDCLGTKVDGADQSLARPPV